MRRFLAPVLSLLLVLEGIWLCLSATLYGVAYLHGNIPSLEYQWVRFPLGTLCFGVAFVLDFLEALVSQEREP